MLAPDTLDDALATLGAVLDDQNQPISVALVGGGALLLAGHIQRPTKDVDVVAIVRGQELHTAEPLPPALLDAVRDVGLALDLEPDWLNSGPTSVLTLGLPDGFLSRCDRKTYQALEVFVASRRDQVALKLYAAADHYPARLNKHLDDLKRLAPSDEELRWAAVWCQSHDPSDAFATGQLQPFLGLFGVADG